MNKKKLKKISFVLLVLALLSFQSIVYGAVTVLPEPNTNPELLEIVQKVVDSFNEIVEKKLNQTFTRDVKIFVCPDRDSYAKVLEIEFEMIKEMAQRRAKFSDGMANWKKNIVAINLDPDDIYNPEYHAYYTTAHELAHQLQFQLSSNQMNKTLYWLVEGTADFFAAQIVEEIGYQPLIDWKNFQFYIFRNTSNYVMPNQITYIPFDTWEKFVEDQKYPYQVSNLMVFYLASKTNGRINEAIVDYFMLTAGDGEDSANFEKCFGIKHQDFLSEVSEWLTKSNRVLGKLILDSKGYFDPIPAIREGFYRSQEFFQDSYGAYVRSNQKVSLALEKHSFSMELVKGFGVTRAEAGKIAKDYSWWSNKNRILMNLDLISDCKSRVFNTAVMMASQFQNQQSKAKLWDNIIWFKRGMAHLFAALITERAGVNTLEFYHDFWVEEVKKAGVSLALADLQSEAEWDQAVEKYGISAINSFSALATQLLMERNELASFSVWLGGSGKYKNSNEAFITVFKISPEDFEGEFVEYLQGDL
jgi:hypothetical protein